MIGDEPTEERMTLQTQVECLVVESSNEDRRDSWLLTDEMKTNEARIRLTSR